eukprot:190991_1
MVNDMNVHTDDADTDTDANTYSKVESAKKNNANRDNDEDDDSKIKSSSSSSEIAKTEDNDIDIDIDIIYQETFTPWFAPLLFLAAPFFYKYGIIIYKNKNHDTNTNAGQDKTKDGGTNMEMEQEQEQSRITFGYGMKGPAITAESAAGGLSSLLVPLSLSPSYWTSHTVSLENIDQASITVGTASALDNLTTFGGWGIRFGRVTNTNTNDSIIMSSSKASYTFTRAYNACNGPYCEFTELISIQEGSSRSGSASSGAGTSGSDDDMDDQAAPLLKGKRYRIVSTDAEKVASLLRSGSRV